MVICVDNIDHTLLEKTLDCDPKADRLINLTQPKTLPNVKLIRPIHRCTSRFVFAAHFLCETNSNRKASKPSELECGLSRVSTPFMMEASTV